MKDKQLIVINGVIAKKRALAAVNACMGDNIMQMTLEPYQDDKTDSMRKGWHLLLGILGKELGYTLPEIKDIIKIEVIGMKQVEWKGQTIDRIPSSEDEKKNGYSNLIEQTYRIGAEMGVILPELKYKD